MTRSKSFNWTVGKFWNNCSKNDMFKHLGPKSFMFSKIRFKMSSCSKTWLRKCTLFHKKIIRIKAFEKKRKCQLCCFHSVKWHKEISFESKLFKNCWFSTKFFPSKSDALSLFRFKFWRVLKRLIWNLTRFRNFDSKSGGLLKIGSKYDTLTNLVLKSDAL